MAIKDVRLIDANALLEMICKKCPEFDCNPDATDTVSGCLIYDVIASTPTIDAQPVMHGRWSECWRDPERNIISVICSACGDASLTYLPKRDLTVDDVPNKICIQMPYCPKCGAKMSGGDTDGNQV
jgi:hypothetical protein